MVHFWSQYYDYMMYNQLLWETSDSGATIEHLIVLCSFKLVLFSSDSDQPQDIDSQ